MSTNLPRKTRLFLRISQEYQEREREREREKEMASFKAAQRVANSPLPLNLSARLIGQL